EGWMMLGRHPDPAPTLANTLRARKGDIELEQISLAAPLDGRVLDGPIVGDRDLVCLVRFRLRNVGPGNQIARLRLDYSSHSGRSPGVHGADRSRQAVSDWLVPESPREKLRLDGELIRGTWHGRPVLRAGAETSMKGREEGVGLAFERELAP